MQTRIITDAATIAIFDLDALRHRIDSDGDWWTSSAFQELRMELDLQNLYLIDTGCDGLFDVVIENNDVGVSRKLNVPSGSVFIVCGEEIPAEGLTPELILGGIRLSVNATTIFVSHQIDGNAIRVGIRET